MRKFMGDFMGELHKKLLTQQCAWLYFETIDMIGRL